MSLHERSQGLYDVHGVLDVQEETSAMLKSKIKDMDRILGLSCASPSIDTSAYEKAVSVSELYAVNSLKLQFLRAETYDARAAADRMVRFFVRKKGLFGEAKLTHDIRLDDLGEEGNTALQRGLIQLLPQRDQAGRAIVFINGYEMMFYENKSVACVCFYLLMHALQDEETQKKGVVLVSYVLHQTNFVPGRAAEHMKTWKAVPWRVAAFHECVEKEDVPFVLPLYHICSTLDDKNVCRFRMHHGSDMECVFKLMTFGIPKETIPIDSDGFMDLTSHLNMLKALALKEKLEDESAALRNTLVPGPMDIQMGRGRHPRKCPGGLRMYHLLLEYRDAYDTTTKSEKTRITELILQKLKQSGCRFISTTPTGFIECDNAIARKKIAHGFRNLRLTDNEKTTMTSTMNDASTKHNSSFHQLDDTNSRKRNLEDDYSYSSTGDI